jgi:hypothetical protein
MTVLCAGLGAGAMGIYALTQDASPLKGAAFWKALAAGAIVGAAVGAAIGALPASLGFTGSLTGWAGFFAGLAADVLVGAVLGGLGPVASHLATGGRPEDILSAELGFQIATGALKGAAYGLLLGGPLNYIGMAGKGGFAFAAIYSALVTTEGVWEIAKAGYAPDDKFSLLNVFGWNNNWFNNSPTKQLGVPSWAFAGTWVYSGADRSAPVLVTMPFAP